MSAMPSRRRMRSSELPRLTVEIGGASWRERVLFASVAFSSLAYSIISMSRQEMLDHLKFSLVDWFLTFCGKNLVSVLEF